MKRFNKMTERQMTKTNGGGIPWFPVSCAIATVAGTAIGVGFGVSGWSSSSASQKPKSAVSDGKQ